MSLAVRDADVLGCWWAMCLSCAARIDGHGKMAGMLADGRVPIVLLFLNGATPWLEGAAQCRHEGEGHSLEWVHRHLTLPSVVLWLHVCLWGICKR